MGYCTEKGCYYEDDPLAQEEIERVLSEEIYWQQKASRLEEKVEYIKRVARIALRRFPELLPGESISIREIKNRLKEIREAGYPVKGYNKLSKNQAWGYLQRIKADIRQKAEIYCPKILREIEEKNKIAIEEARYIR